MKARNSIFTGFTVLSAASVALLSSNAIATTSTSPRECATSLIGDGFCHDENNNEGCGFDGGDCCPCNCKGISGQYCASLQAKCVDPHAWCMGDENDFTAVSSFDDDLDDDSYTVSGCKVHAMFDGYCDKANNNEECGYDGGDCCECTCSSTSVSSCHTNGFRCIDPSAPCVNDADSTALGCLSFLAGNKICDRENNIESCGYDGGDCCPCSCDDLPAYICAYYQDILCIDPSSPCKEEEDLAQCVGDLIGDGKCDQDNNNENCDYDGGDCCECSCVSTSFHTCGENKGFQCVDPSAYCLDGFAEAGTKTFIGVTASAYDERPGEKSNGIGCGEEGCTPVLVRDRVITNTESRWSCSGKIVPDGGACEIGFTFETPQDIVDLQVAFLKGAERERTLKVTVNGDVIGEFDSDSKSAFTSFTIQTDEVKTLTLESVGISPTEWISLPEVRFIVQR